MAYQLCSVPLGSQRALSLLFPDKKIMLLCMCEAKLQSETFLVRGMSFLKKHDLASYEIKRLQSVDSVYFPLALWKMRWQKVVSESEDTVEFG